MIQSFKDKETAKIFNGLLSKRFANDIQKKALVRLDWIDRARNLEDLKTPPSNHLEALIGDLKGFYSIRVNQQFRLIFRFEAGQAFDVALTDYH